MKTFKKISDIFISFLGHMGVFFMITVLLFAAIGGKDRTLSPDFYGVIALFAALMALCSFILKAGFIPSYLARSAIHAVLATASFAVSFVLVSGVVAASTGFVASVIFLAVDVLALTAKGVYGMIMKKIENK